ncbi:SOS response-associated peptidase [Pelagibacterium lentulum]|uniref:Abasic site processing protein n=1 Tax=Pelagibacterium lentulum TaxID=2029865 RepID=A0A916RGF4_9HYPH|nr:SOS response-associated peptidase [Pelagibacterium lentulum]GGA55676.1 DUF159 family protein [Pelagibacterium lentulum]
MCGRYAYTLPHETTRQLFNAASVALSPPRYNIAPTQPIIAVWQDESGRHGKLARWGLVPHWVKDPRDFPLIVNARSETLSQKPAFRDAVKHSRCVIPASGYYEWHRAGSVKQPYYINYKSGEPLAMAGLYTTWIGPEGEEVDTAAVVTVGANADLSGIHDRMPALLDADGIEDWLNVRSVRADAALARLAPAPEGVMQARMVSSRVNSAANDGPDMIEPAPESPDRPEKGKSMSNQAKKADQLDLF